MEWVAWIPPIITGVAVPLFGWFFKQTWERCAKIEADQDEQWKTVNDFRIKVAEEYIDKHELANMLREIMSRFDKLEEKLDRKADK